MASPDWHTFCRCVKPAASHLEPAGHNVVIDNCNDMLAPRSKPTSKSSEADGTLPHRLRQQSILSAARASFPEGPWVACRWAAIHPTIGSSARAADHSTQPTQQDSFSLVDQNNHTKLAHNSRPEDTEPSPSRQMMVWPSPRGPHEKGLRPAQPNMGVYSPERRQPARLPWPDFSERATGKTAGSVPLLHRRPLVA